MTGPRRIDGHLLDGVSRAAGDAPRRRKNHNFHAHESDPCNRLLNAIEPGSYVAPHRHLDPSKGETALIVRGRLGVVVFDDAGRPTDTLVLEPGGEVVGVDLPPGTWHAIVSLAPGSVFFEAKAGPWQPLAADECAPFAPAEGDPEAAAYLAELESLFRR
jgi:cupin fold WbuC family metalloprotein